MKKIYFILLMCSATIAGYNQSYKKADVIDNWMVVRVSTSDQSKSQSRGEMGLKAESDFIISSDGTYNISFENLGKGKWRIENSYIFLFDENETKLKSTVLFIKEINDNKMTCVFVSPTKYYDVILEITRF